MPVTDYFKTAALDDDFRNISWSPDTWYLGLWTGDPTSAGLLSGEVSSGSYGRLQVTFDSNFANTAALTWTAGDNWGSVSYVALCTNASGPYVAVYESVGPYIMTTNSVLEYAVGQFTVTLA